MVTRPARDAASETALVDRAGAAARAGIHLIQIRDPGRDGGPLTRLVARCVEAVHGTRARVIVNDRLDVALAARAHGVHLRGDSMPAARLRRLVTPAFLIGRSVRGVDDARRAAEAGGLDYLIFGTVFPTASKPGAAAAGPAALAAVVATTELPVLAIGGITIGTAADVAAAGAAGVAAIGLFDVAAGEQLPLVVQQVSSAFDTP